ncbi:Hypothetical predicted protein [Pelobates cultripes]|uniref:Uncharacterized protein n=1 Tax=Pelobates cultripes TaxID=61616 RepID=A0AAD1SSZ8_PELCU|nr:Hypothetical predicted protein [Pelobates cultripes]
MNWDTKLDGILNATDINMSRIKERLYARGELTRADVQFDLPQEKSTLYEEPPSKPSSPYVSYTNGFSRVSPSEDRVTVSSQLLSQAKMISSLHQAIGRLERDRDHQEQRIQGLEAEVRHLRGAQVDPHGADLERKMERLKQELSNELRHLQDRGRDSPTRDTSSALRSTASIIQEVNENKRILWKEYESLRRDMDYLHQRLRRQEDDLLRQLSESQDVKRAQERNAKMLEGLLSTQQTHTMDVNRTRMDTQGVQRDLLQIRSSISELKEDMQILEGKVYRHSARSDRGGKPVTRKKKPVKSQSPSSSEDSSSQVSLADISSEDTSYSLGIPPASRGSNEKSSTSHGVGSRNKTTSIPNGDGLSDDLDGLSDSPPELNFSDL